MEEREAVIRLWFDMWLRQEDLGIDDIFTNNTFYLLRLFTVSANNCKSRLFKL